MMGRSTHGIMMWVPSWYTSSLIPTRRLKTTALRGRARRAGVDEAEREHASEAVAEKVAARPGPGRGAAHAGGELGRGARSRNRRRDIAARNERTGGHPRH